MTSSPHGIRVSACRTAEAAEIQKEATPLSMDKLECHFTWSPEIDSTKSNLEELIRKLEKKTEQEPHLKAVHLSTLAYLYTRKSAATDFTKAEELMREALLCDEQIRENNQHDRMISSEFVIRADMLHLEQLKKSRPLTPQETESELKALSELWSDVSSRARVFGVKGATFSCFGPTKLVIAKSAFATALQLEPDNFHWIYGKAHLLAQITRIDDRRKPADQVQIDLWETASKIGEEHGLTDAKFYAYYAEAILHNTEYTRLCEQMANESVRMQQRLTEEVKVNSQVVYCICLKVYRNLHWRLRKEEQRNGRKSHVEVKGRTAIIHRRPQYQKRIEGLLEDVRTIQEFVDSPGIFLEFANNAHEAGDTERAIVLLIQGRELAGKTDHLRIGMRLVELQVKSNNWDKNRMISELRTLAEKFSMCDFDQAAICFMKASLCLLHFDAVDEAIGYCIAASNLEQSLSHVSNKDKFEFFSELSKQKENREEFLAWVADNVGNYDICIKGQPHQPMVDIEKLYKVALARDENNVFALEHLGRFYLRRKLFDLAAGCFENLPADHESRRNLESPHSEI